MQYVTQYDALEEWADLIFGKVVGKLAHLIEKINIFIEDKTKIWFQNRVDEKIDMRLLEYVRDILEQFVQRYPALIVAFLSYLI